MALFPCDVDAHRYHEPQQTLYPALITGAEAHRRKLRLCPSHFAELMGWARAHTYSAQDGPPVGVSPTCPVCDEPPSPGNHAGFFITAYPSGGDREDYWAPVCAVCVPTVLASWQLTAT